MLAQLTMSASGKKICKVCSTSVVKAVSCGICKSSFHPGCVSRSTHPHRDGSLLNCNVPVPQLIMTSSDDYPSSLDTQFRLQQDLIRDEFAKLRAEFKVFRDEIREMCMEELRSINAAIISVTSRVERLEAAVTSPSSTSREVCTEDILSEINDRRSRACNILLHGLEESAVTAANPDDTSLVISRVRDILLTVHPSNYDNVKVCRLGKPTSGICRPLRITLPSPDLVIAVLKATSKYSGPYKFSNDRTIMQREHLRTLRSQLDMRVQSGETNLTIRYVNGVPKIVHRSSKN